ncbi:hypothetical protein EV207_1626 [Scopulibacillus darangshiensis]|uniref:Uncharacterized protein n=1 Tax=Scopulibacillus darangshiensis TaxID=442528 RepID=A0A4R2NE19_9BACL|nr:hypothetical protein [Scopulibacillus darangshiensis]TCP19501.1 hypothetical protein EV207_1626 [Scopulibacillus darangshiensis]
MQKNDKDVKKVKKVKKEEAETLQSNIIENEMRRGFELSDGGERNEMAEEQAKRT